MDSLREFIVSIWPSFVAFAHDNPFCLLAIAIFLLVLHAYIQTMPPRGIAVSWRKDKEVIRIFVKNNTGHSLSNAYLQVNWIKPEPAPAITNDGLDVFKALFNAKAPTEHSPVYLLWEQEAGFSRRVDLENTKSERCLALRLEDDGNKLGFYVSDKTPSLIYLEPGEIRAELQFGGTKVNGEVLIKEFECIFIYDGIDVSLKRIWE